jgi:hypothetical protein
MPAYKANRKALLGAVVVLALAASPHASVAAAPKHGPGVATHTPVGTTLRTSVGDHGQQANAGSGAAKVSSDGRMIAFGSAATNLVPGDTNRRVDVFVRDRANHTTILVSRGRGGVPADGDSRANGISSTGRYVAYDSSASNLVAHDSNQQYDVFVRDITTFRQDRVSVSTDGAQANAASFRPAISGGGRYVAFDSYATNLVPDDTNGGFDVFVRDRRLGTTQRVSVGQGGQQANGESTGAAITPGGRYVVYESGASNLVDGDVNGQVDVFRYDRHTGVTDLVSAGLGGDPADDLSDLADISASGRYVVFTSKATNLVRGDSNGVSDIFVRDLVRGKTQRVSLGPDAAQSDDSSLYGAISDDGQVVTFDSYADNLVPADTNGDPDIFAYDLVAKTTRRVSVSSSGEQADQGSFASSISGDGRIAVFTSSATNLVAGDTNQTSDVFIDRFR